jgi:TrwC relaxase
MLSIGKLGSGQETYYLERVAEGAEDYYSGQGEAEGEWIGQAAAHFDLENKVEPDQLTAMLTGRNPATGKALGLKSAPGREPVPGFDLTFSAPKSVSLTWALGGHPVSGQVMEAHRAAVEAALSYMERSACWARRGKGGRTFVPGQGFLAAAYVHRSSRAGPSAPHPRPRRQRDPRPRRPLVASLPPGDLRAREDGLLPLRRPPPPRVDAAARGRVGAAPKWPRRHPRFHCRRAAHLLYPPRREPRIGRRGRLGEGDAGRGP